MESSRAALITFRIGQQSVSSARPTSRGNWARISLVSRWFSGSTPGLDWQQRLAALFHTEPESLFRHPDDDWIARFLKDRAEDEIERIKATLENAFPRKTGTGS